MKFLVLGGCGIQGRTVLHDLASDPEIRRVICADVRFDELSRIRTFTDMEKVRTVTVDANDRTALVSLFKGVDGVIDLLPKECMDTVNSAAIEAGVNVVNTNYVADPDALDEAARAAGIAILPESGLDPGIDLVLYGHAAKQFDELHVIRSYCGGFPEKKACTNPLNYKVSWTWRGVLGSTNRDARIIRDGTAIDIPARMQHDETSIHTIEFPGLGRLEAIPNGDAVYFTDLMGLSDTIRDTGRYSLRWPGWSAFWHPLKQLGFLDEKPVNGQEGGLSPLDFLDTLLGPQLQYRDDEKDLVAMFNIFEGIRNDEKIRYTSTLLIQRDLDTGILAMSKGVGYSAAIAARMLANGTIQEKGVLSPIRHIPSDAFMAQLEQRGIRIQEETVKVDD